MKITMLAVTSINGKLTNGDDSDIYKWTSKEDQDFFFDQINKAKLIIMGSGTYQAVKQRLPARNASQSDAGGKINDQRQRIVMTSDPEKYSKEQISGVLEFTSEDPLQLINRLTDYKEALLAGGSKIYSAFAAAGLIDEIYLTIEPKVFGTGKPLFVDENFELNLELISSEKLNEAGTLLLKYGVVR